MTEQWQELKETIIELRDNDGTCTQQEVCRFLVSYMDILEKQIQEPKTGYWIGVDGKPSHLQDGMTTGSVWCSECGKWLTASDEYSCYGKLCPNCGAKMESEG